MGLFRRKKNGKTLKVWWMSFTVDGLFYRESTGTRHKRTVEKILKKVETQIAEGRWLAINTARLHDFDELMEKYLNEHSRINKAEATYLKDLSMTENLKETFQGLTLDRITPEIILSYKNKRLLKGAAQNSVKNELGMLRNALNIAHHVWKWTSENPFAGLKLSLNANFIDRWLSPAEETLLLAAAEGKVYGLLPDIITLDLHTGLSQEEILNLKWTQIDFSRRALTITRKKTKKKKRPVRTVPLNATAIDVLKHRAKAQSGSEYVFCNTAGNKIDAGKLKRDFIAARKKSGIPHFRFHDLRHTFATRLVQRGVDLYRVAKLLGHSNITVTERYAHHCPESLRSGVEILEDRETAVLEGPAPKEKEASPNKIYHTFITPAVIKAGEGISYSLN